LICPVLWPNVERQLELNEKAGLSQMNKTTLIEAFKDFFQDGRVPNETAASHFLPALKKYIPEKTLVKELAKQQPKPSNDGISWATLVSDTLLYAASHLDEFDEGFVFSLLRQWHKHYGGLHLKAMAAGNWKKLKSPCSILAVFAAKASLEMVLHLSKCEEFGVDWNTNATEIILQRFRSHLTN